MALPLVFLFDMDNTLISDASLQVARYELSLHLKQKHDLKALIDDLQNGLLRPHFESCVKLILTKHTNAELYIFTAAEKKWAYTMITAMEKLLNIKFNRPIFSREYCVVENGLIKKSITKLAPHIYKKVKAKYNLTHISQLKKQIVLIDNNMVVSNSDSHRFVLCPTYDHIVPCDVLQCIDRKKLRSDMVPIGTILHRYGAPLALTSSSDHGKFMSIYYYWLAEVFRNSCSQSNKNKKDLDTFWLMIEKVFRNHTIKNFNPKVVTYINKNVSV